MNLSAKQQEALDLFEKRPPGYSLMVVRGYAGTGKSSWLSALMQNAVVQVLAPTGKAARRVEEITGEKARTLHSFLYRPDTNEYGDVSFEPKLMADLEEDMAGVEALVVDEASMLTKNLFLEVRRAAQEFGVALILVGDGYQLPPVELKEEAPFSAMSDEFIEAVADYSVDFTEVFRQAKDSVILRVATAIRAGDDIPTLMATNFDWLTAKEATEKAAAYATGEDGILICHTNALRHRFNQDIRSAAGFQTRIPQVGEKLMVMKNNYGLNIANGEIITVLQKSEPVNRMPVTIKDKRQNTTQAVDYFVANTGKLDVVMCTQGLLGQLKVSEFEVQKESRMVLLRAEREPLTYLMANYGYAGTCHKAQGSQYDSVILALEPTIKVYEQDGRRLVYTALTRAVKDFTVCSP